MDRSAIEYASHELRDARHLVVFTGAGVSAASGIPTFRDAEGLWDEFPPDVYGSRRGLRQIARTQPRRLAAFIEAVLKPIAEAEPNPAHLAIHELSRTKEVTVVTQNIDGLHQQAGSGPVHEVHGSLLRVRSQRGKAPKFIPRKRLQKIVRRVARLQRGPLVLARLAVAVRGLAGLGLGGIYQPDLVLFDDSLAEPDWTDANAAVERCDALIQVGTSGQVYPAALLPEIARDRGVPLIDIDPQANTGIALKGRAEQILPELASLVNR